MYRLIFHPQAEKYIDRLDKPTSFRIYRAIYTLASWADTLDTKTLKWSDDFQRLRVGDYRVIYTKDRELSIISIIKVRPRGDVYK